MRDASGRWILGFCGNLGHGNSLAAEVRGFWEGLQQAWKAGFKKICLLGDSLVAVNLIKNGCQDSHPLAHSINRIRLLIKNDSEVVVSHTLREGNMVADYMASYAYQYTDWNIQVLREPPVGCRIFIDRDVMGICCPRRLCRM
ncbi:uncharacterized protein LOC133289995 [Gastrolobium bilobum]|uniref:uncharacterized protein LOC133289995 n=1 Tax=Gastrolobium bilobum TaxID=150636 RepID=UPI002AB0C05E|nr:uncharacterized protein LOC133289995 [Gastrolobium bilobum]